VVRNAEDEVCRRCPAARSLTIVFLACLLSACGGSSGSRNSPPTGDSDGQPGDPVPGLTLSSSASAVPAGGSVTLSWSATDADSCDASGGWSGNRATSGSQSVGPIESETVFRLSCSGPGGGVSRQVTVSIDDGMGPSITFRAEPRQVATNGSARLIWSVDNATACEASGGWSGSQPLSGEFFTGSLARTTTYSLSCDGAGGGNAIASVTVEVLDRMLRWQAPQENVDGTPLTDLAGYVVYWGQQSRSYDGSYRIDDPDVTEWEADIAPGEYFFALTALDSEGNESGYSNEVRKTIP
jgi:hypothetical protein